MEIVLIVRKQTSELLRMTPLHTSCLDTRDTDECVVNSLDVICGLRQIEVMPAIFGLKMII